MNTDERRPRKNVVIQYLSNLKIQEAQTTDLPPCLQVGFFQICVCAISGTFF